MDLEPGDELVAVCLTKDKDDVIMVTRLGQSIRFAVSELRASSRTSGGVRGMRLGAGDRLVSMDVILPDVFLLVVTTGGYGKLTPVTDYPRQHRAGGGVRTFKLVEKAGVVAGAKIVTKSQQVMIISAKGIVTRTPVREKDPTKGITIQGRSTQGVRLMTLEGGDEVASITAFE
jgi:DNA gyrase subunit A